MASSKKDASEILYGRGDVQQIKDKSDNDNNILLFGDENENLDHQGDIHPNFDGDRAKLDILQKLEEDPNYRGPGTDQVETWTGLNLKGLGCRIPESLSRCKNLRMLDVSNNTQMDEEQIVNICSLKTLEELDMSNSNISTISPDIILPKHLKKLDLSQNQLTDLPLPLCDLANLRELDLKGNKIASITPQLKQLCSLKKLDLSSNPLEEFPLEVCKIKTLENISMKNTGYVSVPKKITLLQNLKELSMSSNSLKKFPPYLCGLKTLESLDLSENEITTVPSEIKELKDMKILNLSHNKLGELPLPVCALVRLETLDLENNQISTLPPEISQLKSLKKLNLSDKNFKEFPLSVCKLIRLEALSFRNNNITTVPSQITQLRSVKQLNLSNNKLEELPLPLCELVGLETLYLEGNKFITVPPQISQLKNLKQLNLSNNKLEKIPSPVCELVRLETLGLRNNEITTVSPQVTPLKNLKQLDLSNNKLEELQLPLCELVGLETLYLEGNKFITVPPQISQLKNLKQLNLSNNELIKIPSPVCELVRLEALSLPGNNITSVPPQITQLKNLKQLDLSYNMLKELPFTVCELVRLETLSFWMNKITTVPPEIAQLKNLKRLYLFNNKLEELPLPVCELVRLETLSLQNNQITTVPPQISQLKNLKYLYLYSNKLEELPLPVCELVRLETLDLHNNQITRVPPQITQLKNLKKLYLSNNKLEELPLPVCELVSLETLDLQNNQITTVIPEISQLKKLKQLKLSNNKLEELPLPVCELVRLETLDLQNNQITRVPPQITQLKNLKKLDLSNNKLEELPLPVCELVRLETLDLQNIQITRVPPQITQLKNLKKLYLSNNKLEELSLPVCELVRLDTLDLQNNQITRVPPQITQLKNLTKLYLSNNKLEELPLPVCKLVRLETLDIENNQITTVPPQISQLKNLLDLNLIGNILIQPPQEVADRGKDAVFRYFDDLIKSRATSSSRLQVNILGETCAGKTSLVKTLTSGSPFLTTTSDRTHVMEQIQWSPKEDVFLNINDFGGHEVYKVAHNFFITKEAITLIVFNLQDVSLKYNDIVRSWIDNVHSRAQDSTILLVGSHADRLNNEELETRKKQVLRALRFHLRDKAFELRTILEELEKRGAFRKPYPEAYNEKMKRIKMLIQNPPYINRSINRSVFVTSSQTGYGMVELKEELIRRAKEKKFVLPETWLQMVEHIETAKKNGQYHFLTLESLATMAEKTPPQMQRGGESQRIEDVLNFLHATGVVLWFRDKPLLKNFIFHRQDVFIDILRAVLCHDIDSVLVYDTDPFNKKYTERKFESAKKDVLQRGVISKTMLECLWWRFNFENPGLDAMIELLKKFEICYVVKRADENRYHFPWLLNEDRPNCISSKWPSLPSREKLQISTEVHFPTACPPGLYEMAAVHLHGFLGHYKSTSQDWKDGFYAELDSQFQMCFERRLSGRSTNGVLRLSIRGENPAQLKEHSLVIFQDLVALVEREFPGSPRDEFLVCPHCVREEKDPPTLFDAPKSILNVPLEEPAPYHPCPEEDPNNLASADFFFPVTKGKMTTLHCTSLDKHVNHTVKIIRGTFNSLRKILSRLSKSGMLTEEEKTTFLDPDEDFRLSTFLKAKSDFAFYVFCGALHDSGHPETARMLRLPDLAMELPEDALGEILQKLLDKRVINDQDRDQVWRESDKEQRVSALVRKLREGKRDYEAERAFSEFGDAIDEEIANQKKMTGNTS